MAQRALGFLRTVNREPGVSAAAGMTPAAPFMAFADEQTHPLVGIGRDLVEAVGGVPMPEIPRPAAQEEVDLPDDHLDRYQQPPPHRQRADAVAGMLVRPTGRPAGEEDDPTAPGASYAAASAAALGPGGGADGVVHRTAGRGCRLSGDPWDAPERARRIGADQVWAS